MTDEPQHIPFSDRLPDACVALPLRERDAESSLRPVLVLKRMATNLQPISLGERSESVSYLGAILDLDGRVHRWIEWQTRDLCLAWASAPLMVGHAPRSWCDTWIRRWNALARLRAGVAFRPAEPSEGVATLLTANGISEIPVTQKQDWSVELRHEGRVATCGPEADGHPSIASVADQLGLADEQFLFNATGSPIRGVSHLPLSLEAAADAIAAFGSSHSPVLADPEIARMLSADRGGLLWATRLAPPRRLREKLALKWSLFADACRAVSEYIRAAEEPMLNVSARSFRCSVQPRSGVPLLWTIRPMLIQPGAAVPLDGGGHAHAVGESAVNRTYLPPEAWLRDSGTCHFVLQDIRRETDAGCELSGSLLGLDRSAGTLSGRLTLRLPLASGVLAVPGRIDPQQSGLGRLAFESLPLRLDEQQRTALDLAAGGRTPDVGYELTPQLGPACDLYSLAVLGLRLTACGTDRPLEPALACLHELSAEAAAHGVTTHQQLMPLLADDRWSNRLSPVAVTDEPIDAHCGPDDSITSAWACLIWTLIRMLPGAVPASYTSSLDQVQHAAAAALSAATDDAEHLALATRHLAVRDEPADAELLAVIRRARLAEGIYSDQSLAGGDAGENATDKSPGREHG